METNNKRLFVGSNLKMYKNTRQTLEYLRSLSELTKDISREEICLFIIPSFTALPESVNNINQTLIRLGAQNMFWKDEGPCTGEVSPPMLADIGIDLVEIGHSERRQFFGETDRTVNRKVLAGLKHNFTTLICIGETREEKELKVTVERIRQQVKIALFGVPEESLSKVWIAYEPAWAIGDEGTPADPEYVNEQHQVIRTALRESFPKQADRVPILYGGSVNKENAGSLISQLEIDGLFIGRAAWEPDSFNEIIRTILPIWRDKHNGH